MNITIILNALEAAVLTRAIPKVDPTGATLSGVHAQLMQAQRAQIAPADPAAAAKKDLPAGTPAARAPGRKPAAPAPAAPATAAGK